MCVSLHTEHLLPLHEHITCQRRTCYAGQISSKCNLCQERHHGLFAHEGAHVCIALHVRPKSAHTYSTHLHNS